MILNVGRFLRMARNLFLLCFVGDHGPALSCILIFVLYCPAMSLLFACLHFKDLVVTMNIMLFTVLLCKISFTKM